MPSNDIYTSETKETIRPTCLYIKQHSITGLKYFGKTIRDPYKYLGSGTRWLNHIKKHGMEFVETLWVSEPYTKVKLIKEIALNFSAENNIVNSAEWANLKFEDGLEGGGNTFSALNIDPDLIDKKKRIFAKNGHQQGEKNSQFGKMWITDGVISTKIKKDDIIPDGWRKGRIVPKPKI